jgi:hypothetical protein
MTQLELIATFHGTRNLPKGTTVQTNQRCRHCGEINLVLGPGKAMHAASLSCSKCRRFVGWMPKREFEALRLRHTNSETPK